jgi:hypothetical protein
MRIERADATYFCSLMIFMAADVWELTQEPGIEDKK